MKHREMFLSSLNKGQERRRKRQREREGKAEREGKRERESGSERVSEREMFISSVNSSFLSQRFLPFAILVSPLQLVPLNCQLDKAAIKIDCLFLLFLLFSFVGPAANIIKALR